MADSEIRETTEIPETAVTAGAIAPAPTSADLIRRVLAGCHTVAVVGASANPDRPSYHVMETLIEMGHRMIPVNPGQAGKTIHGQTVYGSLADIPVPVDMVDVFRASDAVAGVVDEALALPQRPKAIWLQLGVIDEGASRRAEAAGIAVVRNRCPAIEYPFLGRLQP
ncbi:CoA-binding protein [Pseudoxanthobacter sp.]|uniref:CoA-binding protein n=1 Tax=Pseudoxanthobacter sp. TaxID=1925742 RepID=UPI002FE34DE9